MIGIILQIIAIIVLLFALFLSINRILLDFRSSLLLKKNKQDNKHPIQDIQIVVNDESEYTIQVNPSIFVYSHENKISINEESDIIKRFVEYQLQMLKESKTIDDLQKHQPSITRIFFDKDIQFSLNINANDYTETKLEYLNKILNQINALSNQNMPISKIKREIDFIDTRPSNLQLN
jgi:hypothetical protein